MDKIGAAVWATGHAGKVIVEAIPGTVEQTLNSSSTWTDVVEAAHLKSLYAAGTIANAEIFSPDNTCGSTLALTSGRAARAIGGEPMVWLIRLALIPPAPARASSCDATIFMN